MLQMNDNNSVIVFRATTNRFGLNEHRQHFNLAVLREVVFVSFFFVYTFKNLFACCGCDSVVSAEVTACLTVKANTVTGTSLACFWRICKNVPFFFFIRFFAVSELRHYFLPLAANRSLRLLTLNHSMQCEHVGKF